MGPASDRTPLLPGETRQPAPIRRLPYGKDHRRRHPAQMSGSTLNQRDLHIVAVEHNAPTATSNIVVAVVDGELSVKTLRQDVDGQFFLEAANAAYEPIRPKASLEILGVVVSVCRRVRR